MTDTISTSLISYNPKSMKLLKMSSSSLLTLSNQGWDGNSDISILSRMETIECSNKIIVTNLINGLNFKSFSGIGQVSYKCGFDNWNVIQCNSNSQSRILCVNCTNYCQMSSQDKISIPFLLSCQDPTPDPIGQLIIFSVDLVEVSPPPNFFSKSIQSDSNSITITAILQGYGSLICGVYPDWTGILPTSSDMLLIGSTPIIASPYSSSTSTSSTSINPGLLFSATYTSTDLCIKLSILQEIYFL